MNSHLKKLFRRKGSYSAETALILSAAVASGAVVNYVTPHLSAGQINVFEQVFKFTVEPSEIEGNSSSESYTEVHNQVGHGHRGAYFQKQSSTSSSASSGGWGDDLMPKQGPYMDPDSVQSVMEEWFGEDSGMAIGDYEYDETTGELIGEVRIVADEQQRPAQSGPCQGSLCITEGTEGSTVTELVARDEEDQEAVGVLLVDRGVEFLDVQTLSTMSEQADGLEQAQDAYAQNSTSGACEGLGCVYIGNGINAAMGVDVLLDEVFVDENGALNIDRIFEVRREGGEGSDLLTARGLGQAQDDLNVGMYANSVMNNFDQMRENTESAESEMGATTFRYRTGDLSNEYYVVASEAQSDLEGINESFDGLYAHGGGANYVNAYAARSFLQEDGETMMESMDQANLVETGLYISDNAGNMSEDYEETEGELRVAYAGAVGDWLSSGGLWQVTPLRNIGAMVFGEDAVQVDQQGVQAAQEDMVLIGEGINAADENAETLDEAIDRYGLTQSDRQIRLSDVRDIQGGIVSNNEDIFWGQQAASRQDYDAMQSNGNAIAAEYEEIAADQGIEAANDYFSQFFTEAELSYILGFAGMYSDGALAQSWGVTDLAVFNVNMLDTGVDLQALLDKTNGYLTDTLGEIPEQGSISEGAQEEVAATGFQGSIPEGV